MTDRQAPVAALATTTVPYPDAATAGETTVPFDPAVTRTGPTGSAATATFPFLAAPGCPNDLGRLGPYRVQRRLGEGGMGFVFLAEHEALCRPVALKVMRPEVAARPTARERFLREGRAAAAVKSDHVMTIYPVGEANGIPFLALECLEGESLDVWLKVHPGPADMIGRVARDVLPGLAAAHAKGLVHRDSPAPVATP